MTLVDNTDTWLSFTDLVFIDPIGTGFSRAIQDEGEGKSKDSKKTEDAASEQSKEYWKITRDLESLAEFITSFLSRHHRWDSPAFIAGESYGGFRVAKLIRLLQESYGVGLNGAILISPALEFALLDQLIHPAIRHQQCRSDYQKHRHRKPYATLGRQRQRNAIPFTHK